MSIDCNKIIQEAEALRDKFKKCNTLSASDMRKIAELIISLRNCSAQGSVNNFVRVLNILSSDLNGVGTIKEQIVSYILSLPEAQRTIDQTDSKWNVKIVTPALKPFLRSSENMFSLGFLPCESGITTTPTLITSYHDGSGILPVLGDKVFIDEQGVTPLTNFDGGGFVYDYINLSSYELLVLDVDGTLISYLQDCE